MILILVYILIWIKYYLKNPNIKIIMKNRNHFIIFSVVIIILIIVGFVSVIVTADNNIKKKAKLKKR